MKMLPIVITRCSRAWELFGFVGIVFVFAACIQNNPGRWEVVQTSDLPHAAGIGPIVFNDKSKGWALTWDRLSMVREHGNEWDPILTNESDQRAFYSFTFISPRNGVVVGSQKKREGYTVLILQTENGGESWHERLNDIAPVSDRDNRPALQSVAFCGPKAGWTVGGNLILHTRDGGLTWTSQHADIKDENVFTVACTSDQRAWVAGTDGTVFTTRDGGNAWERQEIATKDTIIQVRFFGKSGWLVGGEAGKPALYHTRDEGETWQPQIINESTMLFDIFFIRNHGWIAAEHGTVLVSDDGGQTWFANRTPTKENLTSIFFLDPDEGWASGDRKTLLHFSR
jgi:photosystem II stability/assembly factor-like uncharacterized protein